MTLDAEVVRQILRGKRQMVRVPANGRKPKPGACVVRGSKSALRCEITISSVEEGTFGDELVWTIRFKRGTDGVRIPARRPGGPMGDYVQDAARALSGAGEEVSADMLARYAMDGRARHENGHAEGRRRLLDAVATIRLEAMRQNLGSSAARRRLKLVEHQLRVMEHELRRSA